MIPVSMVNVQVNTDRAGFDTVLPKLTPGTDSGITVEQAEKIDLSEEAQKAAEATDKVRSDLKSAYNEAIEQLTALGRPAQEVRAVSKLLSMAEYFGEHSGMTAAEWIRNVAFEKVKEEDFLKRFAPGADAPLFQYVKDITRPEKLTLKPEFQAEVDAQMREVRKNFSGSDAEVMIRTPFFKEFFGDWEKQGAPRQRSTTEDSTPFTSALISQISSLVEGGGNIAQGTENVKPVSVIVDENGEPLRVYHGTQSRFTHFKRGDIGFHFGTREQAESRVSEEVWDDALGEYVLSPLENAGILSGFLNYLFMNLGVNITDEVRTVFDSIIASKKL